VYNLSVQTTDHIAILGYGVEGKALALYLLEHGFSRITICDQKLDLDLMDEFSARLGEDYLEGLDNFDVVFRSPGISVNRPELANVKAAGKLTSMTQFFLEKCPCPVIGVTGTKGKGTTSTLIFEMLKKGAGGDGQAGKLGGGLVSGVSLFLGGNIGQCPMEFLDNLTGDCLVILELSSFQLQDLKKSVRYAVLLNTTVAHLDYHEDREEYMEAKEKLLAGQGGESVAVLNKDYG
jgi:UDP-N-acetylmuramoylalanine--D-glutamate ligase